MAKDDISDIENVVDEAAEDDEEALFKYGITSYGADYTVETLIPKLVKNSIKVPPFQRGYVWSHVEGSRFVESLLLGLPVPGIFLSKEDESQKLLVIDGQQRLLTLKYFYEGSFQSGPADGKVFKLKNVQPQYEGMTYKTLLDEDKLRLDDSIVHATIVKQDNPENDDSSIYHIFERLNTGGRQLYPQEIRNCIYEGKLNKLLKNLSEAPEWKKLYGKSSRRQKDLELILRFFAMYHRSDKYTRPMKTFLNKYMKPNRELKINSEEQLTKIFIDTIEIVEEIIGGRAFRPEGSLNAAVFDSVMTGIAKRLAAGPIAQKGQLGENYDRLMKNDDYLKLCKTATSDKDNVKKRLDFAVEAFKNVL